MADKVQPLLERMVPDLEEQQDAGIYTAVSWVLRRSAGINFRKPTLIHCSGGDQSHCEEEAGF